jgi:hypothetical protein
MKMNVQKVEHNTTGGVHLPKYTIHTSRGRKPVGRVGIELKLSCAWYMGHLDWMTNV